MRKVTLMRPPIDAEGCSQAVASVLQSGMLTEGDVSDQFEAAFAQHCGTHVALTNSCTSAITLAAHMCGIGVGDEVVTTPMTCMATNVPFVNVGANLVWYDIDPKTGAPDISHIVKAITAKTKAVVLVWWAGHAIEDINAIELLCKSMGIKLIIDAAHAVSSIGIDGRHVSQYGDYVCFSFQAVKHLCAGDGGAIASRNEEDIRRLRKIRWFGLDRSVQTCSRWDQQISEAGYKMHMNNINAAIGFTNLARLDCTVRTSQVQADIYDEHFHDFSVSPPQQTVSSYWIYSMLVDKRDEFQRQMRDRGVHVDRVHVRNDTYDCFKQFRNRELHGVEAFDNALTHLPLGTHVSHDDQLYVIEQASEVLENIGC